jgi:hypothetical protein
MRQFFTLRLDDETARRLAVISINEGRSRSALVREAIRRHYGIVAPGGAAPRPNLDAPWLGNGRDAVADRIG